MPKTSRSSPYWQTVHKQSLLPWLANLGNPVMMPHIQGRKTGSHDKTVEKGKDRGGETSSEKSPCAQRNANAQKRLTKRKPLQHPLVQKQVEFLLNNADHKVETCAPSYLLC